MLETILAKSRSATLPNGETLAEHTDYLIKNWLELRERYWEYMPDKEFWEYSFISVLFHDMGKLCENFQDMIQKRKPFDLEHHPRHEFLSGMFLFVNNHKYYLENPLSLFAVFSHHKALRDSLFNDKPHLILRVQEEFVNEFIEYALSRLENFESGFKMEFSGTAKKYLSNSFAFMLRQYQTRFYVLAKKLKREDRRKYIFYKAILNISDWIASGHRELEGKLDFNKSFLEEKIINKLRGENKFDEKEGFNFLDFQKRSYIKGNVLAVAPTGSGKTEASLLWASQKGDYDNIFYLLPTRVTSNAIFDRLCKYFGNDKVAVVHSSAFFLRKDLDDTYEEKEYAFIDRAFFKNVTVCTIDQILTQGFNLGFWEVKTFHQLRAKIIIDEVHLYQPYTLGLILSTIKYLQNEFGAEFYIMTATMPKKLKDLMTKYLNAPSIISDDELLEKARNTFEVRDEGFDAVKSGIAKAIKANKKVLLVLNTVDKAIEAYKHFKPLFEGREEKIICYHSRFIQKDRSLKEKKIFDLEKQEDGCLLVSTQVCEVSLDIDYDILFSENAPIDAIIQRAGRINRKREKKDTKVVIFKHFKVTEEWVYDLPNILVNTFEILKKNQKKLTERELLDLVDIVYKDYDVEQEESFINGLKRYDEIQHDMDYIKDLVSSDEVFTREGLDTISVIPMINSSNENGEEEPYFIKEFFKKLPMEKSRYELSIRRKKKFTHRIESDEFGSQYIDAKYDFEIGLKFNDKSDSSTKHF
jgi:CRISPR-associated endonuclease/helicase Cas3